MSLIKYNPVTPGRRFLVRINNSNLWSGTPFKKLTSIKNRTGGRNNKGRITTNGRAGGAKRSYRKVDFLRQDQGLCVVKRIEYDPNRSANIALIKSISGIHYYIIAPHLIKVGDEINSSTSASIRTGNCLPLKTIPVGTHVHNVEMRPGKGGQLARSAGTFALLVSKQKDKVYLKLTSSEVIVINSSCIATIGQVSNLDIKNLKWGKAGRKRWLGRRPKVRGVAMNPIDHPHGGGEGKSSVGRHPVNKNGKPTKGYRTRNNKRTDKLIIKSRHKDK
jgi:large subunit ribosomal protein L2